MPVTSFINKQARCDDCGDLSEVILCRDTSGDGTFQLRDEFTLRGWHYFPLVQSQSRIICCPSCSVNRAERE